MKKLLLLLLLSLPLAYAASAQGSFMAKYWQTGANSALFQPYLSLQVSRNVIWVMGHDQQMNNFYISSVTPNGTVNFTRRWPSRGFFYGTKATVSTSGMVFLLFLTPNEDTMSIWKLSPAGNVMVRKDYQTPTTVHFGDIAPTSDRGFLAGGGGCVGFHYFMCVDSNANVLWNKSYTQSSGYQSGAPLIIYKIESLDGGNKFRAFGGSTTGIFGMMDIDKSGPKSITYRKFDGFQNAAVLYTNVSRSGAQRPLLMQIGSYPGPNTGTSVGTRTQVGNGFTMAYSDTLGNIKWAKRLDFPDTNIFWSQNFYSVPSRDGGVISVCNFGSMVSANNPQQYNLYIKMDSLGNVVKQYAGSICDTISESIYAFTPIAGDTTFFVVNQTNAPGGISMGRVGHSLNTICKRRPYQCVVRNATLYAADETVDNLLQHTYTPIQADANPYVSIPAARQYYCADTVALRYTAVGALPQAVGIRIYPNPAQGVLHIALPAGMGGATLMMLGATGQLAQASLTLHSGDNVLDVSGMAAGIYVYRIVDGGGDYLNSGTIAVSGRQ